MRVTCELFSCCFASSGVSISTSGPCTKTLGPVRAYGTPFARASTQTRTAAGPRDRHRAAGAEDLDLTRATVSETSQRRR